MANKVELTPQQRKGNFDVVCGLLQAHNMDDLDIVEYPIAELRKYFETPAESKLNSKDANIFLAFIRGQTDSLITFAREIDEDYSESLEDPIA